MEKSHMKFGFIGAGEVAQIYAKHFVRHGHEVILSNRRGPDSLVELARSIGPNARAGTVQEAAKQDIVILCVRWEQAKQALAEVSNWSGRILVDATNRALTRCGHPGQDCERDHCELCPRSPHRQSTQYARCELDSGLFRQEA